MCEAGGSLGAGRGVLGAPRHGLQLLSGRGQEERAVLCKTSLGITRGSSRQTGRQTGRQADRQKDFSKISGVEYTRKTDRDVEFRAVVLAAACSRRNCTGSVVQCRVSFSCVPNNTLCVPAHARRCRRKSIVPKCVTLRTCHMGSLASTLTGCTCTRCAHCDTA